MPYPHHVCLGFQLTVLDHKEFCGRGEGTRLESSEAMTDVSFEPRLGWLEREIEEDLPDLRVLIAMRMSPHAVTSDIAATQMIPRARESAIRIGIATRVTGFVQTATRYGTRTVAPSNHLRSRSSFQTIM